MKARRNLKARAVTARRQAKKRKGFTLVELMLVLLIMGIMIGVVIAFGGGLIDYVQQSMTNSAAKTYMTQAQIAFQQSLLDPDVGDLALNISGGESLSVDDNDPIKARFAGMATNWNDGDTLNATGDSLTGEVLTFSYYREAFNKTSALDATTGQLGAPAGGTGPPPQGNGDE